MKWVTNAAAAAFEAIPLPGFQIGGRTIAADWTACFDCEGIRFVLGEQYGTTKTVYDHAVVEAGGVCTPLTANGAPALMIGPGQTITTDPAMLPVHAGERITLWLYHAEDRNPSTASLSHQRHSPLGDWCGKPFAPEPFSAAVGGMQIPEPLFSFCRMEAAVPDGSDATAIAAFGDSITAMDFWVAPLRQLIQTTRRNTSLLNLGISGNRLLRDTRFAAAPVTPQLFGYSGLKRLDQDVLAAPGISTVLLALGGNDIAQPGGDPTSTPPAEERCTAQELIEGYRTVLRRCREQGIRVAGCTITPFGGYQTARPEALQIRREVNAWILESNAFDLTVDFARAIADPQNKDCMLPAYDSGDHLHPNWAGGQEMARCVDLSALL